MKVASKACAVIFLRLIVAALTSAEQESRAATGIRDFVLAGGVKSNLFGTCSALANTVTGDLFAIDLGGGKEYIRFAPKNVIAVDWVKLNSSGASTDIIACSDAAFARNALMFKINGSCYASGRTLYDVAKDEQDCGDAPAEVVYVMTPPQGEWIGNTFLLYTESSSDGCLLSNIDNTGHVFNDSVKTPYNPGLMPQKLTCCNTIKAGHCVEIASRSDPPVDTENFAYCEAKTRCEALGLQLASYELQTTSEIVEYLAGNYKHAWVNTQRGEGGYYRWLPDGQNNTIHAGSSDNPLGKCAIFDTNDDDLWPVDCEVLDLAIALCIGPNTSLKQC
ncbi:uncharacterized protein LOC108680696 isoform X1 [Hyalella azteca]|uniref:Uncharacterized protein LOC108680696 isoform X1 n=1 Tax=Hyalella azteca TaxID=294128 RepID=A0A979FN17_HYAAZ|nr:uncharacterized protein LOC108680696 isoform X1 [Hyalella azteca]